MPAAGMVTARTTCACAGCTAARATPRETGAGSVTPAQSARISGSHYSGRSEYLSSQGGDRHLHPIVLFGDIGEGVDD